MLNGKKIVVVMPAYKAEHTLKMTVDGIPQDVVDTIILVDDASDDDTIAVAEALGLEIYRHEVNRGYGANQKTCYRLALETDADIIVMVHPDYQYTPKLIPAMAALIGIGLVSTNIALNSGNSFK